MIDEETLQEIVARVVDAAQPSRVIVFGSYGRGDADSDSDLDLMVVKPCVSDQYAEMVRVRTAVGSVGLGVDVLVYSETDVEQRKD